MQTHALKQYDQELDALKNRVMAMGGLVESQIAAAASCLLKGDFSHIDEVVDNDHQVNQMEVALDEDCAHLIAKRQPTAGDLRLILAVSKTVTDLERIGDEAAKIARFARMLHERGRFLPMNDIDLMINAASAAIARALDAFSRQDIEAAQEIISDDHLIDERFSSIMRQIITFVLEDPRNITASLDCVLVAKAIERIGDHAKNIAEYVVYIVRGTDIRHVSGVNNIINNTVR